MLFGSLGMFSKLAKVSSSCNVTYTSLSGAFILAAVLIMVKFVTHKVHECKQLEFYTN